jgi:hypothetical protein
MAVYDILPNEDLRDVDIVATLNANGGTVDFKKESWYKPSANINKWAKYKPVDHVAMFTDNISDWWQGKPSDGRITTGGLFIGSGYASLWGSSSSILVYDDHIDISNDKNGFLYKLCKGTLGLFEYIRPRGEYPDSPYRISDFSGYNPSAVNPLPMVVEREYKYSTAGAIDIHMELATQVVNGLTLEDLQFNNNLNLRSMYFGIVIYNDDLTDILFGTQTAEQKNKGRNVLTLMDKDYATITNKKGIYKAKTFLSNIPIELNDYSAQPSILLADDDTEAVITLYPNYESGIELVAEYKSISSTKWRLVVNVTNNTFSDITITSCKFTQSGDAYSTNATNVPLTILAFKTGQVYYETGLLSGDSFTATLVIDGETYTVSANR